jgi:hypothetical protein
MLVIPLLIEIMQVIEVPVWKGIDHYDDYLLYPRERIMVLLVNRIVHYDDHQLKLLLMLYQDLYQLLLELQEQVLVQVMMVQ